MREYWNSLSSSAKKNWYAIIPAVWICFWCFVAFVVDSEGVLIYSVGFPTLLGIVFGLIRGVID